MGITKTYPEGVSVCVSAYKASKYIEICLDSINAQRWFEMNPEYEILVGVDGCKETLSKVESIMNKYKNIRVFMMDCNSGTYITSNTIMKEARYEWLLNFGADDIMHLDLVEKAMKNKREAEVVRWKMNNFGMDSKNRASVSSGACLFSHSLFDYLNGFKEWRCSGDSDFLKRAKKFSKIEIIDEILMERRLHKDSLTCSPSTGFKSPLREKYRSIIENSSNYSTKDKCINQKYVTVSFKEVKNEL